MKKMNEWKEYAKKIFIASGAPEEYAEIVATNLVMSNAEGHPSHGVLRSVQYYNHIQKGVIKPDASPSVVKQTPNSILIDGNRCFGQVALNYAVKRVLEANKDVYVVGIKNTNHIGRACDVVAPLAREGYAAFAFCNGGGPNVSPYGTAGRVFSTNPVAAAFPTTSGEPRVVDFASATYVEGKLRVAKNKGELMDDASILDKNGNPTRDPNDFYNGGSVIPIGLNKGSALSYIIEMMGGILTGNGCASFPGYIDGNGTLLFAMKGDLFRTFEDIDADAQKLDNIVLGSRKAKGFTEVLLPGQRERLERYESEVSGFEIDDTSKRAIFEIGDKLGIERPQ